MLLRIKGLIILIRAGTEGAKWVFIVFAEERFKHPRERRFGICLGRKYGHRAFPRDTDLEAGFRHRVSYIRPSRAAAAGSNHWALD